MAIFGTMLFPICCVLFANNVISAFGALNALTSNPAPSHELFQSVTNNVIVAMFQGWIIFFSGFFGLFGWVMIFIEYGLDKKYARYLNIIPIIGGIVCLIGLNIPLSGSGFITINSVLFPTGGAILLTGVAGRMGLFNKNVKNGGN